MPPMLCSKKIVKDKMSSRRLILNAMGEIATAAVTGYRSLDNQEINGTMGILIK
jgi:hypothetical protein